MEEYYRHVATIARQNLDVKEVRIFALKKTFCSLRFQLADNLFVDVYYNSVSGRKDFSLIEGDKRVFGYDNLGGWHRHPVNKPESHEPCNELSEDMVFMEMKKVCHDLYGHN